METDLHIFRKLPIELQMYILAYTTRPQSSELLTDIHSFIEVRTSTKKLYFDFFISHLREPPPEDLNWIINDLWRFFNSDYPLLYYGLKPDVFKIFKRHIMLTNDKDVTTFINNYIEQREVESQINILLGLLKPKERNRFVCEFQLFDPSLLEISI
jgi:hypothetical protein